ncbi:MAG: carbamoyltransferase HypF [Pirellulaceae bacterium]|nr:carbamoyltransferase HypF [Pirellulaceae bacterium]
MIPITSNSTSHAERLTLRGGVQGFGIRPAIARLALELQLNGTVRNEMRGVVVVLEGKTSDIQTFRLRFQHALAAIVSPVEIECETTIAQGHRGFTILPSQIDGSLRTAVPVDLRICDACLAEMRDPANRRFEYAFTSCTDCGPRYSVLRDMPYDRERTSMDRFTMCDACFAEYTSPFDRRFHSQSNCCSECGPKIWFSSGNLISESRDAITLAVDSILSGGILALKGLGGYQLLCDATNEDAVHRLRLRKQRRTKPLAVMVRSIEQASELTSLSRTEQRAFISPAGPIVLLECCADTDLAESIHPRIKTVGLMLPTTALHARLLDRCDRPLVVTSGNLEGDPIVYRNEDAEHPLSEVAGGFLHHDRDIVRPIDDSVVRCMGEKIVTIRAARGLTPMAFDLRTDASLLAVGGHQKVSLAVSNGGQSILGPHIGDLASNDYRLRFDQQAKELQSLYGCQPSEIVHDMHPDYFSTRWAKTSETTCQAIQHHHAHIVSGMLENGWMDCEVLGIAMDGTGWGNNDIIQGGEILLSTTKDFEHIGSLRAFSLLGGEAAIHEPYRIAIALLHASVDCDLDEVTDVCGLRDGHLSFDPSLLKLSRWSPLTTSAGRLFDGVASIGLGDIRPNFEGECAMQWEAMCDRDEQGAYPFVVVRSDLKVSSLSPGFAGERGGVRGPNCQATRPLTPSPSPRSTGERGARNVVRKPFSGHIEIDWRPMIRALYEDRKRGVHTSKIAMRFHRGLAIAITEVIELFPDFRVVLSGGVFQNRFLVELVDSYTAKLSREIGWCSKIPPNDGGLSIGQLAIAAARRRTSSHPTPSSRRRVSACV